MTYDKRPTNWIEYQPLRHLPKCPPVFYSICIIISVCAVHYFVTLLLSK